MSQQYYNGNGKGKGKAPADPDSEEQMPITGPSNANSTDNSFPFPTTTMRQPGPPNPGYMTVGGSGTTSYHASKLQNLIDTDSGYGDSSMAESVAWGRPLVGPNFHEDSPIHSLPPSHSTSQANLPQPDHRLHAAAIHQLWYNQHRGNLGRSISRAVDMLEGLQEMNVKWPAHYPSVQRTEVDMPARPSSRPGFQHTNTFSQHEFGSMSSPPQPLRRAMTSFDDYAESSCSNDSKPPEPRLVSPQIAQEFSILKLDLKLGALHQAELVHSLEKSSVASLLDGKIRSSIKHLQSLRERIEDTASKVLVTGDLNAGKSTFCNALLRRKVLPEDQLPCTSIFCEVLDSRENGGIEEVHAVHKNAVYNRNDESTYDVHQLKELEKIVLDNVKYTQCKVYIKDIRSIDQSLLNNGVVDIVLIDAPGLNSDTTKTTAIFTRQEEIDVVVFVVSAMNHFTQTAKEFIWAAAAEKAYIFMVVNGWDVIRDKERAEKAILDQVAGLSPRTHKESSELVHFVSSNAIPMAPGAPGGPGGSGSSSGGGGGDDPSDPKGKGKEKEKVQDFQKLEQSLRRFVLEKRARSKLAPAKTYLTNILNDVITLAEVNNEVAQSELDRVNKELREIEPALESSRRNRMEIGDEIEKNVEGVCNDVFDNTRTTLNTTIAEAGDECLNVPYPGLFSSFQYADDLKDAILSRVTASVADCEEYARQKTVGGVNILKQLGLKHLGNDYADIQFRPSVMFSRRRDALAKQVDIPTEAWDFVDWNSLLQSQEKFVGRSMAVTLATAVGSRLIGGPTWFDHAITAAKVMGSENLRKMAVPGAALAAVLAVWYVLNQIPNTLPHRLSTKIAAELDAIDYVHANSTRVSNSVRKVLRIPGENLRTGLARCVEQLSTKREETMKLRTESDVAHKYFSNLVRKGREQRSGLDAIDLEAPPPGASHY
ncbi:Mitofusin FZO1 [Zalerion maritima]|uniref:Mitofusin FZO1 n=1 Tax=Zalerion maritima TaxID=339359 RepID=A0AAD5WST0_9PEZI|nr:Mitofusin FZO1 [Zalerion maritima]